jgi:hypothetical protein
MAQCGIHGKDLTPVNQCMNKSETVLGSTLWEQAETSNLLLVK